ncbi:MAG: hypothetical protein QXT39_07185 [Conexivisphaerales archaeon]
MRESDARKVVHITGIVLVAILLVHGLFTLIGSVEANMTYQRVSTLLQNQSYFLLLGLLLLVAFIHAGFGIRRNLLSRSRMALFLSMTVYIAVSAYVFYLYLSTVVL